MKSAVLLIVHSLVLVMKALRPSGVKALIAENLLLKHQLGILARARRKSPNLKTSDRFLLGALSLPAESLADAESDHPQAPLCWAERLKRVFKIDITLCPKCGGRLRIIAAITQPGRGPEDPGPRSSATGSA